jgi:hypothetical protein
MADRTRVLIPIAEPIGGQMSAVGIRQFEVGKALAAHCDVTFASGSATNDLAHGIRIEPCRTRGEFRALLAGHDVLYTLGLNSDRFLDVVRSGIRFVLDIYTPLAFEILESWPDVPTPLLSRMHRRVVRWTLAQLTHADFVICTNEKQRDMWLGTLNAIGRVTAAGARQTPDCSDLIGVSSFGIPENPPLDQGPILRSRYPAIGPDDFILLWSSKILAWQDPVTLLRAMKLLEATDPTIRLVFLGVGQPPEPGDLRPFDPAAHRTREAFRLADELGLTGRTVFFITERVPYRDVGSFYLDADAAVSTYPDSLETRFCLGSRLLDFVWAALPMVVSGGELQRDFIERQGIGYVVEPGDAAALASAIRRLEAEKTAGLDLTDRFMSAQQRLKWSVVARPIVDFCTSPVARTRRTTRRVLSAVGQLSEFYARSLGIRAAMRLSGIRRIGS